MENYFNGIVRTLKDEAIELNRKLEKIRKGCTDDKGMNLYISTLKSLRETLNLIKEYDWQLMYSKYRTKNEDGEWINQVSVWEQDSQNNIRNHKVFHVCDDDKNFKDID